ncbi:MAG: hypothetical protein IKD45_00830 [Clostridia bacterium]|nr:hypothetical protein [Clostridia bacterium]
MKGLLKKYVLEFNAGDEEIYKNAIPNDEAYEWMSEHIPLFECPDKDIERTYYFRWWTYRKHIKKTEGGYVVTEFLPDVPWAGEYNVINAPAGHHFYEGRWLRDCREVFSDYLHFYLSHPEDSHRYSSPLLWSLMQYENAAGEFPINARDLSLMVEYYREWEREHLLPSGMFWSLDDRDAMEFSASGRVNGKPVRGIRPTLNSYMYGEAVAIASFADRLGKSDIAREFSEKAARLGGLINENLKFSGFYIARHPQRDEDIERVLDMPVTPHRELLGYIPFMFGIPKGEDVSAFRLLMDDKVFLADTGMTTLEKTDGEYLAPHSHECLWNGYVWPFATSQTLTAAIRLMHKGATELRDVFLHHIGLYAKSHRILKDRAPLPWIDEVLSPNDQVWTSREILREAGWQPKKGGYERGKDYNHSTFCDLIITGIVGIDTSSEELSVKPCIPESWDYFRLEGVNYRGKIYTVFYDKTGERYGEGAGLHIVKIG